MGLKTTSSDDRRVSIHRQTLNGPMIGAKRMNVPFKPTPENPLILSASEIGSFLRCRLQWNWSYRVGLRKKGVGQYQGIGILVHQMLEFWYKLPPKERTVKAMEKIAQKTLFRSDLKMDEKDRQLSKAMAIGYAEWARDDHEDDDASIGLRSARALTEEWFSFPLVKDASILVRGKLDMRWEPTHLKKTLAIGEAKTRGGISFEMIDLNHQLTTYLVAAQRMHPGYKRYIAWRTVLRRQMPSPRVTAPLFGRESVERDAEEIQMWLTDTRRQAQDILDAAIYPTQRDSCAWDCDFYKLCILRNSGNKREMKDVVSSEYEQR